MAGLNRCLRPAPKQTGARRQAANGSNAYLAGALVDGIAGFSSAFSQPASAKQTAISNSEEMSFIFCFVVFFIAFPTVIGSAFAGEIY